jgi:DNA-binding CsgD family transcriptional regulator
MKFDHYPADRKDLVDIVKTKSFDPEIESYYEELFEKLNEISVDLPNNQYLYFFDFYRFELIIPHNNFYHILGYNPSEVSVKMMYDIIHPADRLFIYRATAKSIYYAHKYKNSQPFEDNFTMDFRIKKKNNNYIRVLRNTGVAVNDKLGNMVFSYAYNTDITKIKTSNIIHFDYKGVHEFDFPGDIKDTKRLFTKSEQKVLGLIAKGLTTKEIAEKLYISFHTAETHRKNMLRKTMLHNSAELIVYALENGYI